MSEQKYLTLFIRNSWKYWLAAVIIGLVVGWLVTAHMGPKYQGVDLFTLSNKPVLTQKDTPFYLYDGYYNAQAVTTERNNLANWFHSGKVVDDIYVTAGVPVPGQSADALGQMLEVSDITGTTGANSVTLVASASTSNDAARLAKAAIDYTKDHYPSDTVTITANDPLVLEVPPAKKIVLAGITLAITFIVFLLTLIIHYFQTSA